MKGKSLSLLACFILFVFVMQLVAAESSFQWGFKERVRNTYLDNLFDYNSENDDTRDFIRIRTNLWGQYQAGNLTAKLQITNEARFQAIDNRPTEDGEWRPNEIFIDNLFLSWAKDDLSVTVGRQNLIYGEGFILLDGAPWDGSRAIYHDAVKVSKKFGNTTIDVLAISNTHTDEWPVLNLEENEDFEQILNDGKETALGVYMVKNAPNKARYDLYYFLKNEEPEPFLGGSDIVTDKLTLNHIGGRALYPLNDKMTVVAEGGLQVGSQGDMDVFGWGGYAYLNYKTCKKRSGVATVGLTVFSGDDPDTADKYEGWNPMFGRWPKWSELYIYSHIQEVDKGARKVAYWTNEISPYLSYKFNPISKLNVSAFYYHRRSLIGDVAKTTTDAKVRGNEFQLWLKYKHDKHWSAHFLYDIFLPGNFYSSDDSGKFIRAEIMYTL